MKELLKSVLINFKKNKFIWISGIIAYSFLMTICSGLSYLFGFFEIISILLVACPFIFSFIILSQKSIKESNVELKDIYSGYSKLNLAMSAIFKKIFIPAIILLGFFFVAYIGLVFFDMFFIHDEMFLSIVKEMMNGVSQEVLINELAANEMFINSILICNYVAIGITFILVNLILNKKIISLNFIIETNKPYVNYEYTINAKKELKKYRLFWFNLYCSIFMILGLVVAILLNSLFVNLLNNLLFARLIATLLFFLISSIGIPFKYLGYTYLYKEQFKEEIELYMDNRY